MTETERPRTHVRVKKALPVEIRFADGDAVFASATDVSLSGLQINCEPAFAHTVAPPDGDAPALSAVLRLPGADDAPPVEVTAACTPVFSRPVSGSEYRVGFEFGVFEGDDHATLATFLETELAD